MRSRVACVWDQRTLHHAGGELTGAAWMSPAELPEELLHEAIFLAERDGEAVFALPLQDGSLAPLPPGSEWSELRRHVMVMDAAEAGLLAYARAMAFWHARHRFCGACGAPTEAREAGHVRACTGCGTLHFPRTDPAVIVRVTHRGRTLLGRQAGWDPGVYSVLAGFVEPGESLEAAVAREVFEEAGVRVRDVVYLASQPWPFPGSVMIGFVARADSAVLRVDDELEDARWVSRSQLRRTLADGSMRMPSPYSISHRLIADWLDG